MNYCKINAVTLPFTLPIQWCSDAINSLATCGKCLHFISADAKSGYHQIKIEDASQEKTAFWNPDGDKRCFIVLPFGPKNGPLAYSCMMHFLCIKVNDLALVRLCQPSPEYGSKVIINDILCWSMCPLTVIQYFGCVCTIIVKHRVSF